MYGVGGMPYYDYKSQKEGRGLPCYDIQHKYGEGVESSALKFVYISRRGGNVTK